MEIQLTQGLPHQEKAIDAVCNIFENVSMSNRPFYYSNPIISLNDLYIEENIRQALGRVKNIKCDYLPAQKYLNLDIKMETGTGKTFVYTKTILELHRRFGMNKFVIAVPSLPIKEGTKSFIEDTYVRKFFSDTCGYNAEIELCTVEAAKKQQKGRRYFPSVVRDYVLGSNQSRNKIFVLLVNMALIVEDKKKVLGRTDYDSSVENFFCPMDAIGATRPIVIIDEPHKFSRDQKSYSVIEKRFKPQAIIRYGATFPMRTVGKGKNKIVQKDYCNLIYNLDAYDSFEQGLIKGISKEHFEPNNKSDRKIKLLGVKNGQAHFQITDGKNTKTYDLEKNDSLSLIHPDFGNLYITGVSATKNYIELSNGLEKHVGETFFADVYAESYQEEMMRLALKRHFETEKDNFNGNNEIKIKTLCLFFIDDVSSYRSRDGRTPFLKEKFDTVLKEEINILLSELDESECAYRDYLNATLANIDACQAGYFSEDNSNKDEDIQKQVDVILHDKKGLLSINNDDGTYNTTRFLFSKWTLREGWDNPNVFTICKLRSSGSDISKIQEVGRGLRLPVNTIGNRICNTDFLLNYIVDFTERDFADKLLKEINGERGADFSHISDEQLEKIAAVRSKTVKEIFIDLLTNDIIDYNKNIVEGKLNTLLDMYPEFNEFTLTNKVTDRNNKNARQSTVIRPENYDKLKDLWININHRYLLQYDEQINNELEKSLPKIIKESFTHDALTSQRTIINSEHLTDIENRQGVQRISRTKIKYNDFIIRISKGTNIPLVMIHKAICEINSKAAIDSDYFNEQTVSNVINTFVDWKISNLLAHISYKRSNIAVGETKLSNADGSPKATVAKAYIGTKDDTGDANKRYLYETIDYDSPIEYANIVNEVDNVVVYGKIPKKSICIPTIDGQTYSPDFMYVLKTEDGKKSINLVVESKDVILKSSLRSEESYRISCAKKFFEELKNDGFDVKFVNQLKGNEMVNIIEDILLHE